MMVTLRVMIALFAIAAFFIGFALGCFYIVERNDKKLLENQRRIRELEDRVQRQADLMKVVKDAY